jgi:hypothetical protein
VRHKARARYVIEPAFRTLDAEETLGFLETKLSGALLGLMRAAVERRVNRGLRCLPLSIAMSASTLAWS